MEMRGKRIVIVGAGTPAKRPFLEKARQLGVRVILVDKGLSGLPRLFDWARVHLLGLPSRDHWARGLVSELVDVDLSAGSPEADERAAAALRRSARKRGPLDGLTAYWEDDLIDAARIAQALGLRYHSVEAVETARSKHRTIERLSAAGVLPRRVSFKIESRRDLEGLIGGGRVPQRWFLKPDGGAEAQFDASYKDGRDLLAAYDALAARLAASDDTVFKSNRTFTLTNALEGPEWDYNVVLQGGRFIDGRFTDNWPTRPGSRKATGYSLPSRVLTEPLKGSIHQMVVDSLEAIGARDGVFHVEGIGEDLVEINMRPGGSYTLQANEAVYGVNEAELLLRLAAGLPVSVPRLERPLAYQEGAFVFASERGTIKMIALTAAARAAGLHLRVEMTPGSVITDQKNRVALVYAQASSAVEALALLGDDARSLLDLTIIP